MSLEEEFGRLSERYKSYQKHDNLYEVLLVLTIVCFLYYSFRSFWDVSFAFTFISMIAITYIAYILRQSYALSEQEKFFFHSYSCYSHLDKYVKQRDKNDREKAIENLEEMIRMLKGGFLSISVLSFYYPAQIRRDFEERLLPTIKSNDEKNINQALSVLKEFIPLAQGDTKILYSTEKSQSFKSKMSELPIHRKQQTISILWSKTKSIDGILFVSTFVIPASILLIGVYIFDYTAKEMFPPTATAFIGLLVGFVIRKRK